MTQRRRAAGFLRALKARGVTFDARGRARLGNRYISDRSLAIRIARLEPKEVRAERKRIPRTLDRQLARWGVPAEDRARLTPAKVARLAGVSKELAAKWIARNGVPDEKIDRVASKLVDAPTYREKWKHGRRSKATREEEKQLRRAFQRFVRARERSDPAAWKKYEQWRRIKDFLRSRLSMKAWKDLLVRIGRGEGMKMHGMFSVMRFVLS